MTTSVPKTSKNAAPKLLPPPPPVPATFDRPDISSPTWRAMGMRECLFTTARFDLKSRASAWDTLTIEIDAHNGAPSSKLLIRGQIEANEMISHFRWLADAIAQHRETKISAIRESARYQKFGDGV